MNIHATCVSFSGKGVLLLGDSGSGKSDLALRLITSFGAVLVADDRVDINITNGRAIASAPENIKGLLEVRNIGIVKYPTVEDTEIKLAVKLSLAPQERLPEKSFYDIGGIKVPLFIINPFETSSPAKVLAALSLLCGFVK